MLKDECSVTKFHLFRGTFLNAHRDSSRKLGRRPISAKKDTFLNKKGTKNITTSYLIPFLSVLHQNKALYNFHKMGQHSIVRCNNEWNIGLEYAQLVASIAHISTKLSLPLWKNYLIGKGIYQQCQWSCPSKFWSIFLMGK